LPTYQLTAVARYTEVVTSVTPTANGAIYTFGLAAVQQNPFFEVWFHNGLLADNFNGTGFNTGTKILSGVIGPTSQFQATFQATFPLSAPPSTLIDNPATGGGTAAGKLYWNSTNTRTVTGGGGSNATLQTMQVNSVVLNPTFFPDICLASPSQT